jgi:branched-chain amino acid transport system substrate-binding protein
MHSRCRVVVGGSGALGRARGLAAVARRRRRLAWSVPLIGAMAAGGALVGPVASADAAPKGTPIVLFTEVDTYKDFPGVEVGAKAAAAAVNAAGGVHGRPIEIITCQDTGTSNGAATCGRDAIRDHAIAVVGTETAEGPAFDPVVFGAGIPIVAQGAYSTADLTNSLSFPIADGQASSVGGGFTRLAAALGLKSVYPIIPNLPQATALLPYYATAEKAAGVTQAGQSLVSVTPTATPDYTPYAAAAVSSGTGLVYMDIGPTGVQVMKALLDEGASFYKTAVVADTNVISAADLAPLGTSKTGVYFVGNSYPATATTVPGVKQFNDEINKYGNKTTPRTETMEQAWTGVHVIANLMQKMKTISSAALVSAMKKAGPIQYGPMAPFDWSHKAFTTGLLSSFRIFTNKVMVSRVIHGKVLPIVSGWQTLTKPFKITAKTGKLANK